MCTHNERVMKESCFSLKKKKSLSKAREQNMALNFIFAICKCSNFALDYTKDFYNTLLKIKDLKTGYSWVIGVYIKYTQYYLEFFALAFKL